jgi:hypothetical protein
VGGFNRDIVAEDAGADVEETMSQKLWDLKEELAEQEKKIRRLEREKQAQQVAAEATAKEAAESVDAARALAAAAAAPCSSNGPTASGGSLLHLVPPPLTWHPFPLGQEMQTLFVRLPWAGIYVGLHLGRVSDSL